MQDISIGRSGQYTRELQKIEQAIGECKICGGIGLTKRLLKSRVATVAMLGNDREKIERQKAERENRKSKEHAKSKRENPKNPSYGLCRCRIKADYRKQLTIGEIPLRIADINVPDIIDRDINIVKQKRVDIKTFLRFYPARFRIARNNSIGCNFFGGYGRGKTFISQYLAFQIIKRRFNAHYTSFSPLIEMFSKGVWGNQLFHEIMNVDFLILDDIGNEQQYRRRVCGEISHVLKQRVDYGKVNIFIFNELANRQQISAEYGIPFLEICSANMDIAFKTPIADEKSSQVKISKFLKQI